MAALVLCALPPSGSAFGTAGAMASAAPTSGAGGIGSWPWPVVGEVVGEYANGSDPYAAGQHRGVDIAAPAGTPARAVVAGTVSFSGRLPDGGQTVTLRSADGRHLVSYLHLSRRHAARGLRVAVGQVVGLTGATGRRSVTQPHLHLGVRIAVTRKYVDPMTLLGPQRLAEPVRAPTSAAPAESESKPSAQRKTGGIVPRIEPLERPSANRADVNDAAAPRVAPSASGSSVSRSSARASKRAASIQAPPPIEEQPTEAEPRVLDQSPSAELEEPSAETAADNQSQGLPLRPLLLALTALALIALFFNRRARPADAQPTEPLEAAAAPVANDLVEDRPLLRSVK